MPLVSGTLFAGYTILRLLGSGGMGEVYLAQHPRLPRRDALKILPTDVSTDREFRERFNREADLAATLWHPSVVGVHDRGEFDGQLWIAMDYVEGTNAAQLVKDQYPSGMPVRVVCTIVTAVAGALDYAHQRGLLHRDVKPANILLTNPEDGVRRILLADFGMAWQQGDISELTVPNSTVGTVSYAAPEQLMGSDIDGRADQYALAATAFHLLTGAPPYQHSNPVAVISQHLNAAPPKLTDRRPELAHLDQVLSTALSKDPADRFDRCRQFATALRERAADSKSDRSAEAAVTVAAHATGQSARPPSRSTQEGRHSATAQSTVAKSGWRGVGRRRLWILLGAATVAVALTVIGATGYLTQQKHNTTPIPPGAILDGTYRLVYDTTKRTDNGAPAPPQPNTDNTSWWAYRSLCRSSKECVAIGTKLDSHNPTVMLTPASTAVLHFADGLWRDTPPRFQNDEPKCLGADGKVVAGTETMAAARSMEPQPDGTLRGVSTTTVLTNECGNQGKVVQVPFVATRTGDRPIGVSVADPAGVAASPSTSAPAPPAASPVLNGAYRFDYDNTHQTVNGHPATNSGKTETHWWAFRSLCTSTRCVATGATLADNNQQEPSGLADVVQFIDGSWEDTPSLLNPVPCDTGNSTQMITSGWSFQPQADGTLRGVATDTVITNECGRQGDVYKTPFVVTRIGDVPPKVVLADPTLF
jgi:serine/threonine protein kinase, bacterial